MTRAGLLPTILAAGLAGCGHGINRGDFNLIDRSLEVTIGRSVAEDIEEQHKPVNDPALQGYVQGVGSRVAAVSHRRDVRCRFLVLDAPGSMNAVALPGGWVYVHSGLLIRAESEDELAGVLAHEIGHVCAKHGVENLSAEFVAQAGMLALVIATDTPRGTTDLLDLAKQLTFLRYSRKQEYEADRLGQGYLVAAGYDSRGLKRFLTRVSQADTGSAEFLRTHPLPRKRLEQLDGWIRARGAPAGLRNEAEYAARVAALRADAARRKKPTRRQPVHSGEKVSGTLR